MSRTKALVGARTKRRTVTPGRQAIVYKRDFIVPISGKRAQARVLTSGARIARRNPVGPNYFGDSGLASVDSASWRFAFESAIPQSFEKHPVAYYWIDRSEHNCPRRGDTAPVVPE